jgi:hypothetical protein
MDDEVTIEFLRKEWGSFLKWTVGLSIFLITALLTILAFEDQFTNLIIVTALITSLILFSNLLITWILIGRTLFKIYVPKYRQQLGYKIKPKTIKQFKRLVNNAECYEKAIMPTFIIGFASFILFVFCYVLN